MNRCGSRESWRPGIRCLRAADRHAVPLVKLADALRLAILRELGVPAQVLEPMESGLVEVSDLYGGVLD